MPFDLKQLRKNEIATDHRATHNPSLLVQRCPVSGKPFRILHVVASVDPALGGVAESIRARGIELLKIGHQVEVVSMDDPNAPFIQSYELKLHAVGRGISGWNYHPGLIRWLKDNCHRYDAVIVDGLWQFHVLAVRLALRDKGVPYFVFPHGMLDPWFKSTYPLKHLKKWLFWPWCEYLTLKHAQAVLFTCEEEKRLASESFWLYQVKPRVVPFGTTPPPENGAALRAAFLSAHPILQGKKILLYLGRIHEKKGCDMLIEAFGQIAHEHKDLHLVIAGPGEESLINTLRDRAHALGVATQTHWVGMLRGDQKWGAIYSADLFTLPSHQENFGIAVAEALACETPVSISNKVNIWREISENNAGFVEPDTVAGTMVGIRKFFALKQYEVEKMRQKAREVYLKHFSSSAMAEGTIDALKSR